MPLSTRRRFLLGSLGAALLATLVAWFQRRTILRKLVTASSSEGVPFTPAPSLDAPNCILTSVQEEGPYFISAPNRSDVREDRKGQQANLELKLVRMPDCRPIENAVVEIWHCDAEGIYSGYPEEAAHDIWETFVLTAKTRGKHVPPTNESRFLRGAQVSDSEGRVTFKTIVPGWYDGRAPHIHFKILIDNQEHLTSQFYLDDTYAETLYTTQAPYAKHGKSPYTTKNDFLLAGSEEAHGLLIKPTTDSNGSVIFESKIGIQAQS